MCRRFTSQTEESMYSKDEADIFKRVSTDKCKEKALKPKASALEKPTNQKIPSGYLDLCSFFSIYVYFKTVLKGELFFFFFSKEEVLKNDGRLQFKGPACQRLAVTLCHATQPSASLSQITQ